MDAFEKFGRTIRIYLVTGGQTIQLVDWYDGRPVQSDGASNLSLKCSFTVRRSTNPQPHECELRVWGLSRARREALTAAYEAAEEVSYRQRAELQLGKLRVDAGYGDDAATLFIGDLAPDGVRHDPQRPGHLTTFRALDGRIAWKGRFVSKSAGKNVDINTIRGILEAGGDYMAGKDPGLTFESKFPSLVKKKQGFPGYESGYAIFGESRRHNRSLCETLGIRSFFQDGEVRYMAGDVALLDSAVELSAVKGGLLLACSPLGNNRYRATTLMEHRLRPGRQVRLYDRLGQPIGVGVYRVESMVAQGTNRGQAFHVEVDLVPTALAPNTTPQAVGLP